MGRFVRDILITLAIGAVLLMAADLLCPLPECNYSTKAEYLKEHHGEIKTLVIGHSLGEAGFNTHVLGDSAYCFAMSGRVLHFDMKLMERYLPKLENLSAVVLPLHYNLHPYSRFDDETIQYTKEYIYRYYRYYGVRIDTLPYGLIYRSAIVSGNFHHVSTPEPEPCDEIGYTKRNYVWDGEEVGSNPPNQLSVEQSIEYLTAMAKMLNERGIRFIVVVPPFPGLYMDRFTDDGVRNLQLIADSVNKHYPMEYKSYLADTLFSSDSLYSNWNHLNHRGATMFAERVKEDFGL